jgi:hypothetical protein
MKALSIDMERVSPVYRVLDKHSVDMRDLDRRELWQMLISSDAPQLQQLRSCFLKHLNEDAQLIIDMCDEFGSSSSHEPRTIIDDTLVIDAGMLAFSSVLFLKSLCKLEVRAIKHKVIYSSFLNREEIAVHEHYKTVGVR